MAKRLLEGTEMKVKSFETHPDLSDIENQPETLPLEAVEHIPSVQSPIGANILLLQLRPMDDPFFPLQTLFLLPMVLQ
jgi:hypothetical protein